MIFAHIGRQQDIPIQQQRDAMHECLHQYPSPAFKWRVEFVSIHNSSLSSLLQILCILSTNSQSLTAKCHSKFGRYNIVFDT